MNLLINLRTAFEDGMRDDKCVMVLPKDGLDLLAVIEVAKAMRDADVSIGQQVVLPDAEPDSMADDTALGEFIGIFDGPLQREFDAAIDAAREKP